MNPLLLKSLRVLWIITILICIIFYFLNPDLFSKDAIASFISKYNYIILLYVLIHLIRGFVLLPSTPLVFAGVILFPDRPFLVLTVCLLGIIGSSLLIYFFSDALGFSKLFSKQSQKTNYIKEKLNGKYGGFYITGWAFFPFVPTDLICYVSGMLKVKLSTFLSSIFIGELILCSIYIFGYHYFFG